MEPSRLALPSVIPSAPAYPMPDEPPPYTASAYSSPETATSGSCSYHSPTGAPASLQHFTTCTGGTFTVQEIDLQKIKSFICPLSKEASPHIMEGKGNISKDFFKSVKESPSANKNYIVQSPDTGSAVDLLCIMGMNKEYKEEDLHPDAGFNLSAEKIMVTCQGENEKEVCSKKILLSEFPQHWHNECSRSRDTDGCSFPGQKKIRELKDYVIHQVSQLQNSIQLLERSQSRIDQQSSSAMEKADWLHSALGHDFSAEKKTISSMFEHVEHHLLEVEAKIDHLDKENTHKDKQLKLLQETVTRLTEALQSCTSKLSELETKKLDNAIQRIGLLESKVPRHDGILTWKITDFPLKRQQAINNDIPSIYSEPFYTSPDGYKMCLKVYLNGDGCGKGSYISLFFAVMKGEYDALCDWPFYRKVKLEILSQEDSIPHISDSFTTDPKSNSFTRPATNTVMNTASGCPRFASINTLLETPQAYLKDNVLFIRATVQEVPSNQSSTAQRTPAPKPHGSAIVKKR